MRAAVELANQMCMARIEKRHRAMADYILSEMLKRGALSWTSPDPALRCAIATVTVAPVKMPDLEKALWKEKKVRIRGAAPHTIRLSTPYYLLRQDVHRSLSIFPQLLNPFRPS